MTEVINGYSRCFLFSLLEAAVFIERLLELQLQVQLRLLQGVSCGGLLLVSLSVLMPSLHDKCFFCFGKKTNKQNEQNVSSVSRCRRIIQEI